MDWLKHISYVVDLEQYIDLLREITDNLIRSYEEISRKVKSGERRHTRPIKRVRDWLRNVEAIREAVDEILEEGKRKMNVNCLGGCCPWDIWDSYMLGRDADEKRTALEDLLDEADRIQELFYSSGSPISNLLSEAQRYHEYAEAVLEHAREEAEERRLQQSKRHRWWPWRSH